MSVLEDRIKSGKFIVTSEVGPPKGTDIHELLDDAELLRGRADAINVTDLQSSVMKVGSFIVCHLLKERGHEVTVFASSDSKTKAKLVDFGIPSTHNKSLETDKDIWYRYYQHQMYLASEVIKEYRTGKYDLLHIDEFRVAPYFSEFVEGPITCTYHGIPAEDHDLRFDLDKLRQKRFYNRIKYIAATDKQKELGSKYFNFVATVHHGIDLNRFKLSPRGGDNLAFVGRLIEGKNPDIAIDVAKKSGRGLDLFGTYDETSEYFKTKISPTFSISP